MKKKGRIIIFSGLPGTGKTTVARMVAAHEGIAYLDYDTLVEPFLLGIEREYGMDEGRLAFYRKWREESYGTIIAAMRENAELGASIVVSAPFSSEILDPGFFSSMKNNPEHSPFIVSFHMMPSASVHRAMLEKRSSYRDSEILSDWDSYHKTHPAVHPIWDADIVHEIIFKDARSAFDEAVAVLGGQYVTCNA